MAGPGTENVGNFWKTPVGINTPKYAGKSYLEAFHAQFVLLAVNQVVGVMIRKPLSLCLTVEVLSCLMLLEPRQRANYMALTGALECRFGQCDQFIRALSPPILCVHTQLAYSPAYWPDDKICLLQQ